MSDTPKLYQPDVREDNGPDMVEAYMPDYTKYVREQDYRCVERENAALRHDIERHVKIASDLATELEQVRKNTAGKVVIAITRPEGYEDVHPELLTEDALRDWVEYEILSPVDAAIAQGKGGEMKEKPVAWMRRWYFDGEKERKEINPRTGRMVLPIRFKLLPVTPQKCLDDDVPLFAKNAGKGEK